MVAMIFMTPPTRRWSFRTVIFLYFRWVIRWDIANRWIWGWTRGGLGLVTVINLKKILEFIIRPGWLATTFGIIITRLNVLT